MTQVNPPPQLRIPEAFLKDAETRNYFEQKDFILYQLWLRTGGATDEIVNAGDPKRPGVFARLTSLEQRIGSGDALTSDETGFTVDSITLSVDMTEA